MEPASYEDFLKLVDKVYFESQISGLDWRYGQTYFNFLWQLRPQIANSIRATKYDPFHLDEVPIETHVLVEEKWLKFDMEEFEKKSEKR